MRCFAKLARVLLCVFSVSLALPTALNAAEAPKALASAGVTVSADPAQVDAAGTDAVQSRIAQNYGDLPLSFEENRGQSDRRVRFSSRGAGYTFFLTPREAVLAFSPDQAQSPAASLHLQLAGSNPDAHIVGADPLPGNSNYFWGQNPSKWRTGIPTYRKVAYENIYPGIDLVYYGNQHQLEYDFVVAPGADPRVIRLAVEGAEKLSLDAQGNLVLRTSGGDVRLLAPTIYQDVDGTRREIAGQWNLDGKNAAGFRLAAYDHSRALVIDPVLAYSSFLGGSQKNSLSRIAIDSVGNAYVAGFTASGDFPAAPTPLATSFGGGAAQRGVFVAKIDPTGSTLLYSAYLSGSGSEQATGLAIDASGNAYVTGHTTSADFPVHNAFQSACATNQATSACSNAFLTKISSTGDALVYSTYLGGTGADSATSLAVDSQGSAYVAGTTSSPDFPATAGALQTKCGGLCTQNAFVAKFNATGDGLAYATYLGGSGSDGAADIALDSAGSVYITGHTTSADFPLANAFQKTCATATNTLAGGCLGTAFVAKIEFDGSALAYSTYLGGSLGSEGTGIAVDSLGSAYVTGNTQSADFPVVKAFQSTCGLDAASGKCSVDVFLSKFAPTGKALIFSTYLGGSGRDEASGVALDAAGNAHIVGRTESPDFPTAKPLQAHLNGDSDAFATKFNAAGSALLFSTYHGGSATEAGNGIALDAKGDIYLAGETSSPDFPTNHPFQSSCAGACNNAFVTKMALPPAGAPVFTSPADNSAAPFTVGTLGPAFSVTTSPAATTLTITSGSLPGSLTFTPGGATGTINGTPTAGSGGQYTNVVTFTATNGSGSATQQFTVFIDEAPAIVGPSSLTCTVGAACSAGMSTGSAFPIPTLSATGTEPSGIGFTDNHDGTGTLGGTASVGSGGIYTTVAINATNIVGPAPVHPVNPITIDEAPAILSANKVTFVEGMAGTFTVTTRGFPKPGIARSGATLPGGVTFLDNGDGTGTLSGTPGAGTKGNYAITFTASNGIGSNAVQAFTLTVNLAPTITSSAVTTFTVGTAGSFTVTTSGSPTPTLSHGGATLPSGVSFVDNGDGTGTLSGTPAVNTGGTYAITFTATNSAGTSTQNFTLTVDEAASITSATSTTFTTGVAGTFTVTTKGFPKPSLSDGGATLPSGVTFVDNGNGTGTLSGTPAASTGGTYPITFTAHNGIGADGTQNFILTVNQPPAITSTPSTNCQVLVTCSFTVTTTGFPIPSITETPALPSGLTFTDNGDRSATLSGKPAEGTGGIYSISIKATNAAGSITQTFTLTVADFTAALSGTIPVVIIQGASGSATLTLTAQNGYMGTITPVCAAGTACTFAPAMVTLPSVSNTSTVTVSTATTTPVGTYTVNVTSTDVNGDFHAVSLPYDVECTFALGTGAAAPTLIAPTTAGGSYSFGFTVMENLGGTVCPWTVALSSGTGITVTSPPSPGNGLNTQTVTSVSTNTYQGPPSTTQGNLQVSYFAAAPATGLLNFAVVQEPATPVQTVIAGGSGQVTLPVTLTAWSSGSSIQYTPISGSSVCSVLGPNGTADPNSANFGVTCPAPTITTLSPAPVLTINVSSTTVAVMQQQRGIKSLTPLYALALGLPAIVFLGIGGLAPKRKRLGNSRLLKTMGLLVLLSLLAILPACGGGIKASILSASSNSAFTVTVMGTVVDSTGAVEGVEVETIPLNVTPQI